jgi:hypothetical protein
MPVKKVVNPRRGAARDAHGRFRLKKKNRPKLKARVKRIRRTVKVKAKRRVRNPHLVLMGLNPVRSGRSKSVTHRKRKLKNRSHVRHHVLARKSNPSRRRYKLANRRNPFGFSTPLFLETTGWAIVGGLLTRIVPQAALPNQNSGLIGYGMNGLTAAVAAWLAGQYKREAGLGVAIGGGMMIVARIVSDYLGKTLVTFGTISADGTGTQATVTPVATTNAPAAATQSLSQGDLSFDLRDYRGTYFPLPTSTSSKDLTSTGPWKADLKKLLAAAPVQPGAPGTIAMHASGKVKSNVGSKPTSLSSGRFAGIM